MSADNILNKPVSKLKEVNGYWTALEINQQPNTILATYKLVESNLPEITSFLAPILAMENIRIILTGAGTSSFIGKSLSPYLSQKTGLKFEDIATTDLVSAPNLYFDKSRPTLLVSFGRSGNSPESIASVHIANQILENAYHLVITCNMDGELSKVCNDKNSLVLNLPPQTHDKGFAMTSSYSAMLFAAILCFEGTNNFQNTIGKICNSMLGVIEKDCDKINTLAHEKIKRVAFLGSGIFAGMAQEASLKLMELTNGALSTLHDTPLGFRHGPKTFINDETMIVFFFSNDKYTRKYDIDLLKEIMREGHAKKIVGISAIDDLNLAEADKIIIKDSECANDVDLIFSFIIFAQIFAFYQSVNHGLTPDNPSISGAVNRVVKGVKIHEISGS